MRLSCRQEANFMFIDCLLLIDLNVQKRKYVVLTSCAQELKLHVSLLHTKMEPYRLDLADNKILQLVYIFSTLSTCSCSQYSNIYVLNLCTKICFKDS